jgi:hypothetical protein
MTSECGVEIHWLRHRSADNTKWLRFYPLIPEDASLESTYRLATKLKSETNKIRRSDQSDLLFGDPEGPHYLPVKNS